MDVVIIFLIFALFGFGAWLLFKDNSTPTDPEDAPGSGDDFDTDPQEK